jgi:hypothetical protein
MKKIMKAERQNNIIVHTIDTGESIKYNSIRGGICWPVLSENIPAYYCIVGEELVPQTRFEDQVRQRGRLQLICEHAVQNIYLSLSGFFSRLTDDTSYLLCTELYGITETYRGEEYQGYVEALQACTYESKVSLSLYEAPWAEKPDIGVLHIMNWQKKGLLEIPPDSTLYHQMKQLKPEDLKQIEALNAVNAFRFVVSAFEKYRPSSMSGWHPNRRSS